MNSLPDQHPDDNLDPVQDSGENPIARAPLPEPAADWTPETAPLQVPSLVFQDPLLHTHAVNEPFEAERPLFQQWYQPPSRPPVRIPHFGHVAILGAFALFGTVGSVLLIQVGIRFHAFGISSLQQAITDIHYALGSEAFLYLLMLGACLLFFPMIWRESFFTGVQWNGATAFRLRQKLFLTAAICFALALINGLVLPGPKDAPIDKMFRTPGAPWLLFAFGVTMAPFFEELVFRGFLLPALCTAYDWIHEKVAHLPMRPLDETGQPQWSFAAMVTGSILTSIPFAAMHGAQTGYSVGPQILLVCVSLVLCWARLSTRSLAASVIVHASYNFLLFTLMMLGTSGFQHLDKM